MSAEHDASQPGDAGNAAPADLVDALRNLQREGQAGLDALLAAARALRELIAADLALARRALGYGLVFAAIALLLGGAAWLLLMATLVAALQASGLTWLAALAAVAALNIAGAALCGWAALGYFRHTQLRASRRQLAQLRRATGKASSDAT